ncbi:MAG: GNAT family N-acetyltransferase [Cyanobacteriota bacterium]
MHGLRSLQPDDAPAALEVLIDAVQSQAVRLYDADQVRAWCDHARTQVDLVAALARGQGWGSVSAGGDAADPEAPGCLEAFALRDPPDRLSLLYCRGRSCRQGRASALLLAVERSAAAEGIGRLRTEASQLSRPLLLRHGWQEEAAEVVVLAGVAFERWRMVRTLALPSTDNGATALENGPVPPGADG